MAQITTDMPQAIASSPARTQDAGAMPWPVLAVLALFILGIECSVIYLFMQTRDGRNVSEMIGFFAGLGALVWPIIGLGVLLKVAMATRGR